MAIHVRYKSWYISLPLQTTTWNDQILRCVENRREPRRVTFKIYIIFEFYAVFHNQFKDKLSINRCKAEVKISKEVASACFDFT